MIFGGVIICLIIMAITIYMAVDKKSNTHTRIGSLIALAVMVLSVIICLFIIFSGTTVVPDPSRADQVTPVEPVKEGGNTPILILLVIFLIGIFITVAIYAMKENKKHKGETADNKKPISNW